MIRPFIIVLLILPFISYCQKTDTTIAKKISIGLSFSADLCYRTLSSTSSVKWIADHRDSIEHPMFGYTTGINAAYRLSKRITFEAGLLFSDKGEKTILDMSNARPIDPNDPLLPIKIYLFYHFYYIDIPLKININLLAKRAKLYLFAGISPNIFISANSTSINEFRDGHTSSHSSHFGQPFSKINVATIGGLGFSYDFSQHFYFKIEPTFRLSLNGIVEAPIKEYQYSAGLNAGLFYNF